MIINSMYINCIMNIRIQEQTQDILIEIFQITQLYLFLDSNIHNIIYLHNVDCHSPFEILLNAFPMYLQKNFQKTKKLTPKTAKIKEFHTDYKKLRKTQFFVLWLHGVLCLSIFFFT